MVSWAPHESGCLLACASSDGHVSVLEFRDNSWTHQIFHAHGMGVNSISWAPAASAGSLISSNPGGGHQRRFVTGGSDNLLKIWDYKYVFSNCLSLQRSNCLLGGFGDGIADSSFFSCASLATKQKLTAPLKRWKATQTGSVMSRGRLASSPSRTSRLPRKTKPSGSGHRTPRTPANGPASNSSLIACCGVSAGALVETFLRSVEETTRLACGKRTSRASGRR